ncbi:MAG TPA: hypothetical protein VGB56_04060, partial [Flavisolibacter sp.]
MGPKVVEGKPPLDKVERKLVNGRPENDTGRLKAYIFGLKAYSGRAKDDTERASCVTRRASGVTGR